MIAAAAMVPFIVLHLVHMVCLSSRRATVRIGADGAVAYRTDPMWVTDDSRRSGVEATAPAAAAAE